MKLVYKGDALTWDNETNSVGKKNKAYNTYAYTVFNTSKNNQHNSIIKKCVNFKNYITHKLIISQSSEYTFLRLVYNKSNGIVGTIDNVNHGFDTWNVSTGDINLYHDIEKMVEDGGKESIIGLSLFDMLPTILNEINNSTSVSIDGVEIKRENKDDTCYIKEIEQAIYATDPLMLIAMFICPRKYFTVQNYELYLSLFSQTIQQLYTDTKNEVFNEKYGTNNTILIQIARIFMRTIDCDYLFLSCTALRTLFDFIIAVGVKKNAVLENQIKYDFIESDDNEIVIIGKDIQKINTDDEILKAEQQAMYNTNAYFNPYSLIKSVQYLNLKLISEKKKPLKLTLKDTTRELYLFAESSSHEREVEESRLEWQSWNLYMYDQQYRPYRIGSKSAVSYDMMTKILTPKQKNLYIANVVSMVKDMKANDIIYPNGKYTFGAGLIKNALAQLYPTDLPKEPLDIVINELANSDENRASMILKLYSSMRDNDEISAKLLEYIKDDELMNPDVLNSLNSRVYIDNKFNAKWFNSKKDVLVKSLRSKYSISENIDDRELFAFYMMTHCQEFITKDFISTITDPIIKNKRSSAFDNIVNAFFKQTSSDVLAFLDELKSTLMKDLFINIYVLKSSQALFMWSMSEGISVTTETHILMKESFGLADFKAIHYTACENLLTSAFKSTNSFREKIINILQENAVCKLFSNERKAYNNDARIALFADLLRALSKSQLTTEEQCKIANQYKYRGFDKAQVPYFIEDLSGVMKAISLVPECNQAISVFYTEKYLQEH